MAVQQLEKKMGSLRSWLAHIEMELSRPIVYDTCNEKEIEKKLNQQQVNGTAPKAVGSSTYLCSFLICIFNFTSTYIHNQADSFVCFSVYADYNSAV